jgi:hypothetical protein
MTHPLFKHGQMFMALHSTESVNCFPNPTHKFMNVFFSGDDLLELI